jgi:hypothetical protein
MPLPPGYRPNLDGGIQTPAGGGSGGGTTNSPGSNPTIDLSNVSSTGGLSGSKGLVLVFGKGIFLQQSLGWQFDSTNFDCEEDSEYRFKVEEIEVYRQPTVNNIIIRYRDIGQATINCFIAGNVLGSAVVSKIVTVVFGGKADNKIYTTKFDLTFTCEAPQLIITRNANSGPDSIVKVLMELQHGDAKPQ